MKKIFSLIAVAISTTLLAFGGWVAGTTRSIHDAYLRRYPLERRPTAWDRAIATFDQAFMNSFWGIALVILGLDKVTNDNVDALAVGKAIVNLEWTTIGTLILGAFVIAFLAAAKAWTKWAVVTGPAIT